MGIRKSINRMLKVVSPIATACNWNVSCCQDVKTVIGDAYFIFQVF